MKHPIPFRKTPLVLAIAASLISPTLVQAAPGDPLGPEFRVSGGFSPTVAMDVDGDFVVAWQSADQSGTGIYAQRYNRAGVAQGGGEFQVNTYTTNQQWLPTVAMDADGAFVMAWYSDQDGDGPGIYARRYVGAGGGSTMAIDIKPETSPNRINPGRNDRLPVAILGTSTFDTTQVDPTTVRFSPDQARDIPNRRQFVDVNGDGDLDLVLRFRVLDTGIQCGDTAASLRTGNRGNDSLELTQFCGHLNTCEGGVHDAENTLTLSTRVSPAAGGAGARWAHPRGTGPRISHP